MNERCIVQMCVSLLLRLLSFDFVDHEFEAFSFVKVLALDRFQLLLLQLRDVLRGLKDIVERRLLAAGALIELLFDTREACDIICVEPLELLQKEAQTFALRSYILRLVNVSTHLLGYFG